MNRFFACIAISLFALAGCATDVDDAEEDVGESSADLTKQVETKEAYGFRSPTGKINCMYYPSPDKPFVACEVVTVEKRFWVGETGNAVKYTPTDAFFAEKIHVIPYGTTIKLGKVLKCTSRDTGMSCKSTRTEHGFRVAAEKQELF